MSQLTTAELEVSDAAFTPRPSQIPNVMDTVHRRQLLLQEMTSRAEALRQAANFHPVVTPTPVSSTTLSPTSYSREARTAPRTDAAPSVVRMPAMNPVMNTVKVADAVKTAMTALSDPLVSAASNFVGLVEAVKASPVLAEMRTALTAQLPEAAELATHVERAIRSADITSLESHRSAITSTLSRAGFIVRATHELMSGREVEATSGAIVSSFRELDYGPVRIVQSGGARILKARKGTTVVVAKIEPAGALKIDTAGFGGRDCEKPVAQFIATLASHGLLVRKKETLFHGRADGGELVRDTAPLFDPLVAEVSATATTAANTTTAGNTAADTPRRIAARRVATRA